jgi:mRNA interferase RelE/StbE
VTYEVDWEPPAVDLAARYLMDDPEGLSAVLAAVDSLAEDPRPDRALPLGMTGVLRLRAGKYRVGHSSAESEQP